MKQLYFLFSLFCASFLLNAQTARINEINYDNSGSGDTDEFVEIFITNPQPADLSTYTIDLYNGNGGASYNNIALNDASITVTSDGLGSYYVWTEPSSGIQNGAPDGVALSNNGTLIEFLSYEGDFAATDGPAVGVTSTDIGVSQTNSTPVGQSLQFDGTIWQGPTASTKGAVNVIDTDTSIQFAGSTFTTEEGNGVITLNVQITNPSTTNATTVEVALGANTATNGTDYETTSGGAFTFPITLTFPANSSANQTIEIQIIDDMDIEGEESFTLNLQNPMGGTNVSLGTITSQEVVIQDNDFATATCSAVGSVIITEIMQNPSAVSNGSGEWFELYNTTANAVDIQSWVISDDGSDSHTIGSSVTIPANGYVVLGNNMDSSTNGGVTVNYDYGTSWFLSNGADEVIISCSGTEIDRVNYDGGATFPDPSGASMSLNNNNLNSTDNDNGANWFTSEMAFGDGDLGTPGTENETLSVSDFNSTLPQAKLFVTGNTLNISNIQVSSVEVYNVNGQRIASSKSNEVNISKLASGVGIAVILDQNGNKYSEKFIKQ